MKEQKIGIIGLGIVGLPLKKYFERKGLKRNKNLFCYDADLSKGFNDDINQKDLLNPDTKKTTTRVVRGGYFRYFPGSTSSDSRSARLSTDRQPSIGLRLVKTL